MIKLFKWFLRGVVFYVAPLVVGLFVCAHMARADVVFGKVMDFYRSPLAGVEVTISRGTETVGVVESGSDGYFAAENVSIEPSDALDIDFVMSKFISSSDSLVVGDTTVAEFPDVLLQRGTGTERTLTVTVTSDSDPVHGARVRFKRAGSFPIVSYTNGSGTCSIGRLREKLYGYTVTCDGFFKLRGTKQVTVSEALPLVLVSE